MKAPFYLYILIALLTGCDKPSQPPEPKTRPLQSQHELLDKSKEVQQTVNDQSEQQAQAIEQQSE